jgi:hypothetical protein
MFFDLLKYATYVMFIIMCVFILNGLLEAFRG